MSSATAAAAENGSAPGRAGWISLVVLRVLIGWHLLYEGVSKLIDPGWTSAGYLGQSQWIFSGLFVGLAADPTLLAVVDFLNEWGLTLIGLGLLLGLFTRMAAGAGIVLLALYYVANPPLPGYEAEIPGAGDSLIVNAVLIEAAALYVLLRFRTGEYAGLDRLLRR